MGPGQWSHKFAIRFQPSTAHRVSTLEPRQVCSPSESLSAGMQRKDCKKQKEFPERTTASHHRNVRPNFVPLCPLCLPLTSFLLYPQTLSPSDVKSTSTVPSASVPLDPSPNRMSANYRHLSACNPRPSAHVAAENMHNLPHLPTNIDT